MPQIPGQHETCGGYVGVERPEKPVLKCTKCGEILVTDLADGFTNALASPGRSTHGPLATRIPIGMHVGAEFCGGKTFLFVNKDRGRHLVCTLCEIVLVVGITAPVELVLSLFAEPSQ